MENLERNTATLSPVPPRGFEGQEPPTMDTKEAAWLLSCSVKHVRDLCESGDLKAARVGKLWRINRAQVYALAGVEGGEVA